MGIKNRFVIDGLSLLTEPYSKPQYPSQLQKNLQDQDGQS
jgi:hypothetical protein